MMKLHAFLFLAFAALAGVSAFTAPSSRQAAEKAPTFVTRIPGGYRDWRLISVAREEGNLDDIRAHLLALVRPGFLRDTPAELLAVDPVLPAWMPSLTIRGLRVGAATVTLRFERDAEGRTSMDVIDKAGTLHIVRQPPMESLTAGVWDRLRSLISEPLSV